MVTRRKTLQVRVRNLLIGGEAPVSIQSMTSVPIEDVAATVAQIRRLAEEGADLVRVALRNEESIGYLRQVRREVDVPLSADVHFNYRIALLAIQAGIDKIRLNPGNIGGSKEVGEVVRAAMDRGVPIRIGVNGGSLDRNRYSEATAGNLVSSAFDHIGIFEDNHFSDIVVSIKSSDLQQTVEANRLFASRSAYPLHVGLTEAGYGTACVVRSSIAIGSLLMEGVGDTVRVSMTGDPVEEVAVAKRILEAVGHRTPLVRMVSCPTCGRTDPSLDVLTLARAVEERVTARFGPRIRERGGGVTVAVMGCEVNGPGEASHADIGLAGGRGGTLLLFGRGRKIGKVNLREAVDALEREMEKLFRDGG